MAQQGAFLWASPSNRTEDTTRCWRKCTRNWFATLRRYSGWWSCRRANVQRCKRSWLITHLACSELSFSFNLSTLSVTDRTIIGSGTRPSQPLTVCRTLRHLRSSTRQRWFQLGGVYLAYGSQHVARSLHTAGANGSNARHCGIASTRHSYIRRRLRSSRVARRHSALRREAITLLDTRTFFADRLAAKRLQLDWTLTIDFFMLVCNALPQRIMSRTVEPAGERAVASSAKSWDVSLCQHCIRHYREIQFLLPASKNLEDAIARRARSDGTWGVILVQNFDQPKVPAMFDMRSSGYTSGSGSGKRLSVHSTEVHD